MLDARSALAALIRDRREDFASLSALIGRNPAYIQQFIKRGSPKALAESDRRVLASYFGVDEAVLGGPPSARLPEKTDPGVVLVPYLDVGASAGPGALVDDERPRARFPFDRSRLRELSSGRADRLSIIRVAGDSMSPTLSDGDEILVDLSDSADRLRDGIYVLRHEGVLNVKRIAIHPAGGHFAIRSDSDLYPDWPDCPPGSVEVVGRVVWAGRKIA